MTSLVKGDDLRFAEERFASLLVLIDEKSGANLAGQRLAFTIQRHASVRHEGRYRGLRRDGDWCSAAGYCGCGEGILLSGPDAGER